MHHYTYLIQHKTTEMRYIGVRTSKCPPVEDTKYWGSSKHLPSNIQETHRKIILKEHSSRKEALEHEILLHRLNNVAESIIYYNKAKQTAIGFDTTGTVMQFTLEHKRKLSSSTVNKPKSLEHRRNCSIAQKAYAKSKDYVNPRQGVVMSEMLKNKISQRKKELGCDKGSKNNRFKPWFISTNNVTQLFYTQTKEEYSIANGFRPATFQSLATMSKGIRPITKGPFKGLTIGNIPQ